MDLKSGIIQPRETPKKTGKQCRKTPRNMSRQTSKGHEPAGAGMKQFNICVHGAQQKPGERKRWSNKGQSHRISTQIVNDKGRRSYLERTIFSLNIDFLTEEIQNNNDNKNNNLDIPKFF